MQNTTFPPALLCLCYLASLLEYLLSDTATDSDLMAVSYTYSSGSDDKILAHVRRLQREGDEVSDKIICKYARNIIRKEVPRFKASSGWLCRFRLRHGIPLDNPKKTRITYSAATDKKLADYVRRKRAQGFRLTQAEIRNYARGIIRKECPYFRASDSWVQNFLLRHGIFDKKRSSSPRPSTSSSSSEDSPTLISQSPPASPATDETALQPSLPPVSPVSMSGSHEGPPPSLMSHGPLVTNTATSNVTSLPSASLMSTAHGSLQGPLPVRCVNPLVAPATALLSIPPSPGVQAVLSPPRRLIPCLPCVSPVTIVPISHHGNVNPVSTKTDVLSAEQSGSGAKVYTNVPNLMTIVEQHKARSHSGTLNLENLPQSGGGSGSVQVKVTSAMQFAGTKSILATVPSLHSHTHASSAQTRTTLPVPELVTIANLQQVTNNTAPFLQPPCQTLPQTNVKTLACPEVMEVTKMAQIPPPHPGAPVVMVANTKTPSLYQRTPPSLMADSVPVFTIPARNATGVVVTKPLVSASNSTNTTEQEEDEAYSPATPFSPSSATTDETSSSPRSPRSPPSKLKRSRNAYSLEDKVAVVRLMQHYKLRNYEVCNMLDLPSSTMNGWVQMFEQYELRCLEKKRGKRTLSDVGWEVESPTSGREDSDATFNQQASSGGRHEDSQKICLSPEDIDMVPAFQRDDVEAESSTTSDSTPTDSGAVYAELEQELVAWIQDNQVHGVAISVKEVCKKAQEIISRKFPSFEANLGWVFRFLYRKSILLRRLPINHTMWQKKRELKRLRKQSATDAAAPSSAPTPKKARRSDSNYLAAITPCNHNTETSPPAAPVALQPPPSLFPPPPPLLSDSALNRDQAHSGEETAFMQQAQSEAPLELQDTGAQELPPLPVEEILSNVLPPPPPLQHTPLPPLTSTQTFTDPSLTTQGNPQGPTSLTALQQAGAWPGVAVPALWMVNMDAWPQEQQTPPPGSLAFAQQTLTPVAVQQTPTPGTSASSVPPAVIETPREKPQQKQLQDQSGQVISGRGDQKLSESSQRKKKRCGSGEGRKVRADNPNAAQPTQVSQAGPSCSGVKMKTEHPAGTNQVSPMVATPKTVNTVKHPGGASEPTTGNMFMVLGLDYTIIPGAVKSQPTLPHPSLPHPLVAHPLLPHPLVAHPSLPHPLVAHPSLPHPLVAHPSLPHPLVPLPSQISHPSLPHRSQVSYQSVPHPLEQDEIMHYVIEHSVREASERYGMDPSTLKKKMEERKVSASGSHDMQQGVSHNGSGTSLRTRSSARPGGQPRLVLKQEETVGDNVSL